MYGRGTYGVVRALTDAQFRERNSAYLRRFGGDTYGLVMRIRVVEGQTITPDWTAPDTILHEWPEVGG
jgi:hypothetical protein